jgi:ABC-2 type transport system ATP-binding protein
MSDPLAIETRGLTRTFGSRVAVDALDLHVPPGAVYGFLGPNGAGKTTTIRMLLGLMRPTDGDILLHGEPFSRDRRGLLRNVGALVESPSLYPHLTGEEHLEVIRRLLSVPVQNVREVLELFDLAEDARRPVRTYSTGMRQLLGLAAAWLGHPSLLVLDEPANGLDPAATRKLRGLLRRAVAEQGATVFVSSHVLGEIEQIADQIGIIHRGRLVFQGALSSLRQTRQGTLEDIFLDLVAATEEQFS